MSTRGAEMKNYYKQTKKTGAGISKPSAKGAAKKSNNKSTKHSTSLGSGAVQPPALISHGGLDLEDEFSKEEEILRQFDLNMAFGPCLGITRMARWERANRLGLNPPKDVEALLKKGKVSADCLWDGRI